MMSLMYLAAVIVLMISWVAWAYPFVFRAPHRQKRSSVARVWPGRAGGLLEFVAVLLAFGFQLPPGSRPGAGRLAAAMVLGPAAALLAFSAVRHLGRQFRIHAGLYHDHELVRSGPYALVRHPIYASVLFILLATLLVLTPWRWIAVSVGLFIAGTEIRVRAEDGLLASRFGEEFAEYRRSVPAYLPFIR